MTSPIPTTKQAALIRAIYTHHGTVTNGHPHHPALPAGATTARRALHPLTTKGWVSAPEDNGTITATLAGLRATEDREALDAYRTIPAAARITIRPRRRGLDPITRRAAAPGRDVNCSTCYNTAKENGVRHPEHTVWFTNRPNTQREAEIAAGKHYLRHLAGGDLPRLTLR